MNSRTSTLFEKIETSIYIDIVEKSYENYVYVLRQVVTIPIAKDQHKIIKSESKEYRSYKNLIESSIDTIKSTLFSKEGIDQQLSNLVNRIIHIKKRINSDKESYHRESYDYESGLN